LCTSYYLRCIQPTTQIITNLPRIDALDALDEEKKEKKTEEKNYDKKTFAKNICLLLIGILLITLSIMDKPSTPPSATVCFENLDLLYIIDQSDIIIKFLLENLYLIVDLTVEILC
jgi:hypothetical protein